MTYRLGIALSGGGVRGVAHAGVLAALAEHGLEPDCVSGTSSGALVGAFYASGQPPSAVLEFFRERSPFKLSKLSLGKPGLIDSEKVRGDLAHYFPDDRFEALGRRLFVTATDILSGRPAVFSSGPLLSPLLASAAVPLLFSPVDIAGRLYCDGGIVDNFPVGWLAGMCEVIIGSYAGPLVRAAREDLDSTLAVTQRALDIGVYLTSRGRFHLCDVLLCPPQLSRFKSFEGGHLEEIFAIGHRAATEQIGTIRAALELGS
jgi:NTE family protein